MPRLSRRHRARIAAVTVFCLLFQQLALAAYACTMENDPSPAAAMVECHTTQADASRDPLCQKHCAPDSATAAEIRTAGVAPLALPPERVLPRPLHAVPVGDALRSRGVPSVHAPPDALAFARLLI